MARRKKSPEAEENGVPAEAGKGPSAPEAPPADQVGAPPAGEGSGEPPAPPVDAPKVEKQVQVKPKGRAKPPTRYARFGGK